MHWYLTEQRKMSPGQEEAQASLYASFKDLESQTATLLATYVKQLNRAALQELIEHLPYYAALIQESSKRHSVPVVKEVSNSYYFDGILRLDVSLSIAPSTLHAYRRCTSASVL